MKKQAGRMGLRFASAVVLGVAFHASASAPPGRYAYELRSDTVYDSRTKLTWQRATTTELRWSAAQSYCSSLSLSGRTGWRLPTLKELQSLLDYRIGSGQPMVDPEAFPMTPRNGFWSSTSVSGTPSSRWKVKFADPNAGSLLPDSVESVASIRCVIKSE